MVKIDDYTQILLKDKGFWSTLCMIYEVLANENTRKIVRTLLDEGETRSSELLYKNNLTESQFYPIRKKLETHCLIEKIVHQDRSVYYQITPFAKNVLNLSKPLLEKIEEEVKQKTISI